MLLNLRYSDNSDVSKVFKRELIYFNKNSNYNIQSHINITSKHDYKYIDQDIAPEVAI